MGYSPWGRRESDMTEQLHFLFPEQVMYVYMRAVPTPSPTELSHTITKLPEACPKVVD